MSQRAHGAAERAGARTRYGVHWQNEAKQTRCDNTNPKPNAPKRIKPNSDHSSRAEGSLYNMALFPQIGFVVPKWLCFPKSEPNSGEQTQFEKTNPMQDNPTRAIGGGCSPYRTGLLPAFGQMQGDSRKMQRGRTHNLAKSQQISIVWRAPPYSSEQGGAGRTICGAGSLLRESRTITDGW